MIERNQWVEVALAHANEIYFPDLIRESGIPQERFEEVMGPRPWKKSERAENKGAIDQLIRQSSDLMGIEVVDISANIIAAFTVIFVSPINWLKVAMMFQNARRAEDLGDDESGNYDAGMTATQLHSLMWLYATGWETSELSTFRNRVINTAFRVPATKPTKKAGKTKESEEDPEG